MNSLNFRTPTKKVWDKFRKVNGIYKPIIILLLERGRNIITSPNKIADHYEIYQETLIRKVNQKEQKEEDLPYNKPFTDRELKRAIKQ